VCRTAVAKALGAQGADRAGSEGLRAIVCEFFGGDPKALGPNRRHYNARRGKLGLTVG